MTKGKRCGCLTLIAVAILLYLLISGHILSRPGMIDAIVRFFTGK